MIDQIPDISEHNNPDLQALWNAGARAIFIRASYGTATGAQKDAKFDQNWRRAKEIGFVRFAYHYAYPGRSGAAVQAAAFAAIVGPLQQYDGIALDMEHDATFGRLLVQADVDWSYDFLQGCARLLGPKGLQYINQSTKGQFNWQRVVDGDFGLWLAMYGANNGQRGATPDAAPWKVLALHQYTSQAALGGYRPLDMNVFFGDLEALKKYGLQGAAPAPAPQPQPSAPVPVAGLGTSYVLAKAIPGYQTAADAAARKNSNSTAPAGTLYVFNQAAGMVNVTKQPGIPGWWINPGDNIPATAAAVPSGNFQLVKQVSGFVTAADAAAHRSSNSSVPAGSYFVFNTYAGMVNITRTPGQAGWWINPADNAGAPQNIPAPATYTVAKGDTVDGISGKYGLSKAGNYAQFRALNPRSGHNGDWANLWPGDVVRVR